MVPEISQNQFSVQWTPPKSPVSSGLINGGLGWCTGLKQCFLLSAFSLMNGGLGWIHGIEMRFLIK